ncbi:MAG: hypothetical protein J3K34DRAFT_501491, partial [Monoraphidium minutum]
MQASPARCDGSGRDGQQAYEVKLELLEPTPEEEAQNAAELQRQSSGAPRRRRGASSPPPPPRDHQPYLGWMPLTPDGRPRAIPKGNGVAKQALGLSTPVVGFLLPRRALPLAAPAACAARLVPLDAAGGRGAAAATRAAGGGAFACVIEFYNSKQHYLSAPAGDSGVCRALHALRAAGCMLAGARWAAAPAGGGGGGGGGRILELGVVGGGGGGGGGSGSGGAVDAVEEEEEEQQLSRPPPPAEAEASWVPLTEGGGPLALPATLGSASGGRLPLGAGAVFRLLPGQPPAPRAPRALALRLAPLGGAAERALAAAAARARGGWDPREPAACGIHCSSSGTGSGAGGSGEFYLDTGRGAPLCRALCALRDAGCLLAGARWAGPAGGGGAVRRVLELGVTRSGGSASGGSSPRGMAAGAQATPSPPPPRPPSPSPSLPRQREQPRGPKQEGSGCEQGQRQEEELQEQQQPEPATPQQQRAAGPQPAPAAPRRQLTAAQPPPKQPREQALAGWAPLSVDGAPRAVPQALGATNGHVTLCATVAARLLPRALLPLRVPLHALARLVPLDGAAARAAAGAAARAAGPLTCSLHAYLG